MIILDFLIAVAIGILAIYLVKRLPDSSCTGDCNQGRNCNCR
jgi:hypothetical protein